MRAVLDTSVLVAALRSPSGISSGLLQAALESKIVPLVSAPLFLEYESVLTRTEHLTASGLASEQVHLLLDTLADVIEPVRFTFRWRPAAADPGDDMVLETAINGNADALVTFNVRDFRAAKLFGVEVLSPKQTWETIDLL